MTRTDAGGRMPLDTLPPRDWAAAGQALERDGVVMLKGALTQEAVGKVESAVAWSLAHPSPTAVRFYPGEAATFFEDRGSNHAGLVRDIGLDTTMSALWGVDRLWYMGEQLFLKEGGASRRTPWHQDTSYLRMMGSQLVACWISLDLLPKEHCLEFVRGSHKGVLYNGSAFAAHDDTAPFYKHSQLPRLPDIQAGREAFDIVSWDLEPGDVIVFHLGVLHGGAGTAPRPAPANDFDAVPRPRRRLRRPAARRAGRAGRQRQGAGPGLRRPQARRSVPHRASDAGLGRSSRTSAQLAAKIFAPQSISIDRLAN